MADQDGVGRVGVRAGRRSGRRAETARARRRSRAAAARSRPSTHPMAGQLDDRRASPRRRPGRLGPRRIRARLIIAALRNGAPSAGRRHARPPAKRLLCFATSPPLYALAARKPHAGVDNPRASGTEDEPGPRSWRSCAARSTPSTTPSTTCSCGAPSWSSRFAAIKRDWPIKIRPSREAEILCRLRRPPPRRLSQARAGARSGAQLITATLSFEGPFSVAVYLPDGRAGLLGPGARPLRRLHADVPPRLGRAR